MGARWQKAKEKARSARNRAGTWWEWKGKPGARKLHHKAKKHAKTAKVKGRAAYERGYAWGKPRAQKAYRRARDEYGRYKAKRKK